MFCLYITGCFSSRNFEQSFGLNPEPTTAAVSLSFRVFTKSLYYAKSTSIPIFKVNGLITFA